MVLPPPSSSPVLVWAAPGLWEGGYAVRLVELEERLRQGPRAGKSLPRTRRKRTSYGAAAVTATGAQAAPSGALAVGVLMAQMLHGAEAAQAVLRAAAGPDYNTRAWLSPAWGSGLGCSGPGGSARWRRTLT